MDIFTCEPDVDNHSNPLKKDRILARKVALELTGEEIKEIAGGRMSEHVSGSGPCCCADDCC